jgi:hypothetical protein
MQGLLDVDFMRQKLLAVIDQIKQLQSSDFPYREPNAALTLLEDVYERNLVRLNGLDEATSLDVRQHACAHANSEIARDYPFLGFILRSTNIRNAFEIYDPLLNLCKTLYGSTAKLIVSSEWAFSPFTYPAVAVELPDLMFIGLPSTEAGNSLIVPLAGHELGHSVWRKPHRSLALGALSGELQKNLTNAYLNNWSDFQKAFEIQAPPETLLTDLFLRGIWTQSFRWADRQAEELFCDILGLRLFGEGFIYSFIYLIAPSLGDRANHYPSLATRAEALAQACDKFATDAPPDFGAYFVDPNKRLPNRESFILKMADTASANLIPKLLDAVEIHVASTSFVLSSDAERDRIVKHFCALSPASGIKSLGDIINAGWKIRLDWALWDKFGFSEKVKIDVLNDLVYKTMEVMEFESKMKAY